MLPDLKIHTPELEPDAVLLEQLSQLSRASVRQRREGPLRALVAGATVLVLACFSWLTGTMPGVASPFDSVRDNHPAPHHATDTSPDPTPGADGAGSGLSEALPPGLVRPHHDQGNHTGLTKPNHHDQGNHTGLNDAQQDNGNHTGQTKPHQNSGNHTGQTKPHQNSGNHTGPTKPRPTLAPHDGQTKPRQDNGNETGRHT